MNTPTTEQVGALIDELVKKLTEVEYAYKKVSEQNARHRDIVEQTHGALFDALVTNRSATETVARLMEIFYEAGYGWAKVETVR